MSYSCGVQTIRWNGVYFVLFDILPNPVAEKAHRKRFFDFFKRNNSWENKMTFAKFCIPNYF